MVLVYGLLTVLVLFDIVFCFVIFDYMKSAGVLQDAVVAGLVQQNNNLGIMLSDLQREIESLNKDLELLARENKNLNYEVSNLSKEVERLQVQINEPQGELCFD